MTQKLIQSGADTKASGWVASKDGSADEFSPLQLVLYWISKFEGTNELKELKTILIQVSML
jgi:hypothetical protein